VRGCTAVRVYRINAIFVCDTFVIAAKISHYRPERPFCKISMRDLRSEFHEAEIERDRVGSMRIRRFLIDQIPAAAEQRFFHGSSEGRGRERERETRSAPNRKNRSAAMKAVEIGTRLRRQQQLMVNRSTLTHKPEIVSQNAAVGAKSNWTLAPRDRTRISRIPETRVSLLDNHRR